MTHQLRVTFIAFLALFSVNFSWAQEQLFNGLLDGFTMPVRIVGSKANTSVDIGIDTIRYVRGINNPLDADRVSFDAHANLRIPFAIVDGQESTGIKFRGTNLILTGNGSSTMYAETDLPLITVQENKIWLRIDEGSVDFNCEGLQGIGLRGAFLFNQSFIESASNPEAMVEASFDIQVADWDDLMFAVHFSAPFKVKGCGDFVFEVTDALVDFSTQSNVTGFTFPRGYDTGFLSGDENLWTGFALKKLKITPPEELKDIGVGSSDEATASRPFTYTISNMLIDESGLTGSFSAERPAQRNDENRNKGLNVSINKIGVSIMQSYIVGGVIAGEADVPLLKDREGEMLVLGIDGQLQYDRVEEKIRYRISGTMLDDQTYGVPFTSAASITLSRGCSFTVGNDNSHNRFGATLLLNGMLNIGGDKLTIKGIRFEQLELSTFSPHFDWRYFGLEGSIGMNYGGFLINLTELSFFKDENEAGLHAGVMLALMDGPLSIAAATEFTILAEYKNNDRWEYKGIDFKSIMLDLDFSVFSLKGSLTSFDGKTASMYGDGFEGDIKLTLGTFNFSVDAHIRFGNTDYNSDHHYKYWYTKITTDMPGKVVLFPSAVMLKSITGGAYQRMKYDFDREKLIKNGAIDYDADYVPDKNTAFGFMAGIGIYFAEEELASANALFEMAFNTHFGLKYVRLEGRVSILSDKPEDKKKGLANAALQSYYDVENKIFSMDVEVMVDFVNVVTGNGSLSIYTSPDTWYCHIGTRENPNTLKFIKLTSVESYFMFGAIPSQLPPLSSKVLALFGTQASSTAEGQTDKTLLGKGFAFGISLSADCGFGKKRGFVFAYIDVEGGTDALVDFNTACKEEYDVSWRAKGQAYAYVDGQAGVRVRRKKFRILQISAAAALYAEFPTPYYLSGKIAFRFKVLFIKGQIRAGYSAGRRC